MDIKKLLERYAAGERDFTDIKSLGGEGIGIDLSGVNLSGVHFDFITL